MVGICVEGIGSLKLAAITTLCEHEPWTREFCCNTLDRPAPTLEGPAPTLEGPAPCESQHAMYGELLANTYVFGTSSCVSNNGSSSCLSCSSLRYFSTNNSTSTTLEPTTNTLAHSLSLRTGTATVLFSKTGQFQIILNSNSSSLTP